LHTKPGTASTSPCATIRYEEPYRTRKITDPQEHKKEKAKFMQLWMSNRGKENEQKWNEDSTSTKQTLQSPLTMDTRHGRLLRECAHRGDDLSNIHQWEAQYGETSNSSSTNSTNSTDCRPNQEPESKPEPDRARAPESEYKE
jgi:hypothetical protein